MKSNAPGQLLGYTLQFPRALYHLLKSGPGDTVSTEVLGDVAIIESSGEVTLEEDKSSIVVNPLTDRSTDLWKTFANWIEIINDRSLDVRKTNFILYCNQSGRHGIVDEFSSAQNQQDAQKAIDYAKKELNDIGSEHDIWKYYDNVMNQNETLLLDIVERFKLQIGKSSVYDELRYEIQRKNVPENLIDFLMDKLSGWFQKDIIEKIASKERSIVSWNEFNNQFLVLFDRARRLELIDFTSKYSHGDEDIQNQVKCRPIYLQQLEAIDTPVDDIIDAVSDYLRANVNRDTWIENGIIDEEVAFDFEIKLLEFWKNQSKRIQITGKNLSEKETGQLLFADCKSRQEKIRDMDPPHSTIAGTYHALADEPVLGWHPSWKKFIPEQKEGRFWDNW